MVSARVWVSAAQAPTVVQRSSATDAVDRAPVRRQHRRHRALRQPLGAAVVGGGLVDDAELLEPDELRPEMVGWLEADRQAGGVSAVRPGGARHGGPEPARRAAAAAADPAALADGTGPGAGGRGGGALRRQPRAAHPRRRAGRAVRAAALRRRDDRPLRRRRRHLRRRAPAVHPTAADDRAGGLLAAGRRDGPPWSCPVPIRIGPLARALDKVATVLGGAPVLCGGRAPAAVPRRRPVRRRPWASPDHHLLRRQPGRACRNEWSIRSPSSATAATGTCRPSTTAVGEERWFRVDRIEKLRRDRRAHEPPSCPPATEVPDWLAQFADAVVVRLRIEHRRRLDDRALPGHQREPDGPDPPGGGAAGAVACDGWSVCCCGWGREPRCWSRRSCAGRGRGRGRAGAGPLPLSDLAEAATGASRSCSTTWWIRPGRGASWAQLGDAGLGQKAGQEVGGGRGVGGGVVRAGSGRCRSAGRGRPGGGTGSARRPASARAAACTGAARREAVARPAAARGPGTASRTRRCARTRCEPSSTSGQLLGDVAQPGCAPQRPPGQARGCPARPSAAMGPGGTCPTGRSRCHLR